MEGWMDDKDEESPSATCTYPRTTGINSVYTQGTTSAAIEAPRRSILYHPR